MSGVYADSKAAQVGIAVFLSFLVIIGLIGNTLVILIILTKKSMKSPMNYLLVNLAVADIMVGVFLTPKFVFNHSFTHPDGLTGKILCTTITGGTLSWVGQISSCLSLVAISVERYFAIMHPYSAKLRLSKKKVIKISLASWICAITFNAPLFVVIDYEHRNDLCTEQWPESKPWMSKAYGVAWFFLAGIIPIATMSVLYSRVIYSLWFKQHQVQGTQLAILKSRKRVTKMMFIVSVVYAVCIIPNIMMYVIKQFNIENVHFPGHVSYIFSSILVICNSTVNPFIYALQSATFRSLMLRFMCCTNICNSQVGIQTESGERPMIGQDLSIRLNTLTNVHNS